MAQFYVKGLRQTQRGLKAVDSGLGRELGKVNRAAAETVVVEARRRAPIGAGGSIKGGGQLRGSIRALGSGTRARVRAGGGRILYAAPIHWGWPSRNIKAQPFLHEAAVEKRDLVIELHTKGVDELIRRAIRSI